MQLAGIGLIVTGRQSLKVGYQGTYLSDIRTWSQPGIWRIDSTTDSQPDHEYTSRRG